MANVKFVKGKPLGKTWKKVIEEQLMKHGARLARVELTAGRQRDAERVTVRVKKIVENVVPDPDTTYGAPRWVFGITSHRRDQQRQRREYFQRCPFRCRRRL